MFHQGCCLRFPLVRFFELFLLLWNCKMIIRMLIISIDLTITQISWLGKTKGTLAQKSSNQHILTRNNTYENIWCSRSIHSFLLNLLQSQKKKSKKWIKIILNNFNFKKIILTVVFSQDKDQWSHRVPVGAWGCG